MRGLDCSRVTPAVTGFLGGAPRGAATLPRLTGIATRRRRVLDDRLALGFARTLLTEGLASAAEWAACAGPDGPDAGLFVERAIARLAARAYAVAGVTTLAPWFPLAATLDSGDAEDDDAADDDAADDEADAREPRTLVALTVDLAHHIGYVRLAPACEALDALAPGLGRTLYRLLDGACAVYVRTWGPDEFKEQIEMHLEMYGEDEGGDPEAEGPNDDGEDRRPVEKRLQATFRRDPIFGAALDRTLAALDRRMADDPAFAATAAAPLGWLRAAMRVADESDAILRACAGPDDVSALPAWLQGEDSPHPALLIVGDDADEIEGEWNGTSEHWMQTTHCANAHFVMDPANPASVVEALRRFTTCCTLLARLAAVFSMLPGHDDLR